MTTRLKKNRNKRGHVSAGHGRVGKHRKHPGGRGLAGSLTHHRINTFKYHPGYIGKCGMRQFNRVANRHYTPTVNVNELWSLLSAEEKQRVEASSTMPVLDVTRAGFFKVLGNGPELKRAMVVKAREFSKNATEKITSAGGQCIILGKKED